MEIGIQIIITLIVFGGSLYALDTVWRRQSNRKNKVIEELQDFKKSVVYPELKKYVQFFAIGNTHPSDMKMYEKGIVIPSWADFYVVFDRWEYRDSEKLLYSQNLWNDKRYFPKGAVLTHAAFLEYMDKHRNKEQKDKNYRKQVSKGFADNQIKSMILSWNGNMVPGNENDVVTEGNEVE